MKLQTGVRIGVSGVILAIALLVTSAIQAQNDINPPVLNGAGATFPAPLYKKWIAAYKEVDPGTTIKYAVVGSGEGIKRFLDDTVDFGASDVPLTDFQIASAPHGAITVLVTAGMVVLAYNLPGLNGVLKLNRDTYSALLRGEITRWNDARIQAINPRLNLPDREIRLVVRKDSSGTTFVLSSHLSAISPEWRDGPGIGKRVSWPENAMFAPGNEGVAALVQRSVGSIGYVEYSFAKLLDLKTAHLENKEGHFIAPDDHVGIATLTANIEQIPADMRIHIPDPAGTDTYPLISFTWLLLKKHYPDGVKGTSLKRFITWCLGEGQSLSSALGYIRLPDEIAKRSNKALATVQTTPAP
ncbi:phosphate ABC transporter substrate-binding protein PstS [Nitrosomonas sp. HPC101]|uniref:phosphate ABC transporter substrate-binding protein PstS n=1 Tax=Nitrosomonas sp. HPC101 TaxID=1658667 RepID=UPI00136B2747|nr:phosphate ABC transporter substrate-binding protein PstS [Nitrosomonas sp. HPC101]MXS85557.1 phosphate ABC transporter substrate-binding protein PstS [Nitrosomonas sp. HPC101]